MMHGLICNIHSTQMEKIHHGKLLATRLPGIFTTSTEVTLSSTFHQPHSEENSKTTTSLLPNHSGTGTLKTERSVGTLAALPLLTRTTLSASTSPKQTVLSEVNVKRETSPSKRDGLCSKLKRTEESPFSRTTRLAKQEKDSTVISTL